MLISIFLFQKCQTPVPKYKYVKNLIITNEEMVKTTTLKIKRKVEMEKILKM